jgi:site-specific recombinase XerC
VADVLGYKRVSTTLIYAKLDLKALAQAALPSAKVRFKAK